MRPDRKTVRTVHCIEFHIGIAFNPDHMELSISLPTCGGDMTRESGSVVCIVDDDRELRATLRHQLEDAGMRVFESANGRDGVQSAELTGASIAIVDIVMPDQEGLETIRALRLRVPGIRLLAMTGFDNSYLEMAKKFGADDVLRKPFTGRELLARVRQLLGE